MPRSSTRFGVAPAVWAGPAADRWRRAGAAHAPADW